MFKHVSAIITPKTKQLNGDKKQRVLIYHWQDFVGEYYAQHSRVDKITFSKHSGEKCLTILTHALIATELTYETDNIMQKINDFFGEHYISKIRIKQGLVVDK